MTERREISLFQSFLSQYTATVTTTEPENIQSTFRKILYLMLS